jgi:hypothetical protein
MNTGNNELSPMIPSPLLLCSSHPIDWGIFVSYLIFSEFRTRHPSSPSHAGSKKSRLAKIFATNANSGMHVSWKTINNIINIIIKMAS